MHHNSFKIIELIKIALDEDIGTGDITSQATLSPGQKAEAKLIAKQDLIVCGQWVFEKTFQLLDPTISVDFKVDEGDFVQEGKVIANIEGPLAPLLSAERTALNFMQRMSGIATLTHTFVQLIKHTNTNILDTRKTLPAFRILDKHAVKTGGGVNHRMGLFDMAMIKDNHIAGAGSITKAVAGMHDRYGDKYKIEVEVKNLTELKEALNLSIDRIMLDNMSIEEMTEAVKITAGKIKLEASGTVSLETVKAIAETGVDHISIGALTHSIKAADLSLLVK